MTNIYIHVKPWCICNVNRMPFSGICLLCTFTQFRPYKLCALYYNIVYSLHIKLFVFRSRYSNDASGQNWQTLHSPDIGPTHGMWHMVVGWTIRRHFIICESIWKCFDVHIFRIQTMPLTHIFTVHSHRHRLFTYPRNHFCYSYRQTRVYMVYCELFISPVLQ